MMTHRITSISIAPRFLSPMEAELIVRVCIEPSSDRVEIRGRLVGPTSLHASTIEVAYPLHPLPGPAVFGPLARRVVIPEPSLWSPATPFLYRGIIELVEDGRALDRVELVTGVRSIKLAPDGVRWNGTPLALSAVERDSADERELMALRREGVNALVVDGLTEPTVRAAERVGFALLARPAAPDPTLPESPAFLAWLLPPDWREREAEWLAWLPRAGRLVGAATDGRPLPAGVQFVIGGEDEQRPRLW